MSKGKSFRFRDNSGTPNHFEPGSNGQEPAETVDAWRHEFTQSTAWKTDVGGRYAITLNTVKEEVEFVITSVTGITVEVTYGYPMTAVTKIDGEVIPNAPVTWAVEKSGGGNDPYNNTKIDQNGWLTLDNYEPDGKEMVIRAVSNYNSTVSETCTFTIAKYPNVWLVGDPQGWSLPGAGMERSQNGQIFTWQGTITQNTYFRFNRSFEKTGNDDWVRNWLCIKWNNANPRQINVQSSGEDCEVAEWDNQNPSVNGNEDANRCNWQFTGTTGTYKILLDVSTMTVSIEAVP
jgi:hypothetical protein